jgi:diguanylate cyclase (GGDEF)-like protein
MDTNSKFLIMYNICLWLGIALGSTVAWVSWTRRSAPGAAWFVVQNIAIVWWLFCYAFPFPADFLLSHGGSAYFRFKLIFFGVVFITPTFFALALEFTGKLKRRKVPVALLLCIEPIFVWLTIWNPATESLFFGDWRGRPEDGYFKGGVLFWLHTVYSYVLTIAALGVLLRQMIRESSVYRKQLQLLLLSAIPPMLANLATLAKLSPVNVDYTPLGFALASVMIGYALFKHGLLDLIPIARKTVVENMTDAVVVLDNKGRIMDANPAAYDMLAITPAMTGSIIQDVFPQWRSLASLNSDEIGRSVDLLPDGRYLDVRVTVINSDKGKLGGRLLILRDVTEMVHASNALGQANEQLRGQLAEIERMQVLLHEQALRDSLTGLYNRRYLDEMLEREFQYAKRTNGTVALALLDIDHFKNINDTYGHLAGDEALKELGKILAGTSRSTDVACRYGGEEFIVVLKDTSISVACQRVEEWRKRFSAIQFGFQPTSAGITFSAGIATFPDDAKDKDSLIDAADKLLYAAKAQGRDRIMCAPGLESSMALAEVRHS